MSTGSPAIIQEGHRLEPKAAETVRGDSFVAETNIHYPTDSSLIGDGLRKVLCLAAMLAGRFGSDGRRQEKYLYRKTRRLVRKIERIAARKGDDYQQRMKKPYRELLELAEMVFARADTLRETVQQNGTGNAEALALDQELETFLKRTRQVCGTARRRVLGGETIPNREKLFSILACRCREPSRRPGRRRRRASSSARRGSRTRESNRRSARSSRATGWSAAATERRRDSNATSDWACWAGIFTCWASC